tara:strand:+ start:582 stop:890 length:309 start_codon:yes stop_codon:yes gene_type:complete
MTSQADKIRSINSPGWDGVNANVQHLKVNNFDAQKELDKVFHRCFTTEAGQKVMKYLRNVTIEQPSWEPGAEASHGWSREGQDSIVREIEARVKRANGTTTS